MKKIISFVIAAMLAVTALAGCSTGTSDSAKDTGSKTTFTVGFDQNFPPMGFVGDGGQFTGFDLELAAEVCNRLGYEIKYQPIEWDAKDAELNAGTIDCIWNGFTMLGREDDYTWTEPYMANRQIFVVKSQSGIKSAADLKGKIVDVQKDSAAEEALNNMPDLKSTFKQMTSVADYNTAFMELESGAIDAVAMDSTVAQYQIRDRASEFLILDDVISEESYGVGFKKGNTELKDKVEKTLKEMAADGTLAKISTKWFGKDVTTIK